MKRFLPSLFVATALLTFSGCGKKETGPTAGASPDAVAAYKAKMDAYYASKPEFFHYKTMADLPQDLTWEDGHDLPDLGSPEAKKGGTMNFWIQDFPRTLRHVGPDSNGSFRPWILDDNSMLFARRHPNDTAIGPDGFKYYPGIASSWAFDGDNKTVYIKIDPDATWSDGVPITTDDVFYIFYFYQSPWIQAPWYNNYFTEKYTGVTRYDDKTFAFHFPVHRPDMGALALEGEPVPMHFFTEFGEDYPERYQWRDWPTSGAYVVKDKDIDKGRAITLTRNPDWWAKDKKFWRHRFNPDRIRLTVIRDAAKAFEAFKKGELDWYNLSLAEYWYDKLPDSDPDVAAGYIQKVKFYNDIPRPTYGLWMNESNPRLANRDIRVGINYASNWALVIEKFSRGDWTRMQTSADGYGEFTHPTLKSRPFDVDKALAAFAKAGFTKRGPDGILVNDQGERLSIQITTGYENLKDVLTILREEAQKAGLEFRIEVLDLTAAWKKAQEKKHEIMFSAFNVGPELFPRYWETYHSANAYDVPFLPDGSVNPARQPKPQTNNLQSIAYPALDQMIEAYDTSESIPEMKQLAFKMEEFMYDDASFCPGFNLPFIRTGKWRWLRMPEDGNVKIATSFSEYALYWVDEERKQETLDARKSGQTFEPGLMTFDQYKVTP